MYYIKEKEVLKGAFEEINLSAYKNRSTKMVAQQMTTKKGSDDEELKTH